MPWSTMMEWFLAVRLDDNTAHNCNAKDELNVSSMSPVTTIDFDHASELNLASGILKRPCLVPNPKASPLTAIL